MLTVGSDRRPAPALAAAGRAGVAAVVLALAVVTVAFAAGARAVIPPAPVAADAPAGTFFAQRAVDLLGGIAVEPHPTGTPAQARVRDRIVADMRAAGLDPRVDRRAVVAPGATGRPTLATVEDVHATIPGTDPTGRVLLVARYDSVPTGPGASDDGINAAAILEIGRILAAGPRPRNDIVLLLTDGEEHGMLGAHAALEAGIVGDPDRAVAVNLEARGTSGRALLFQTVGTGLVPAVGASGAFATTAADAVYPWLNNATDLDVLASAGVRGLNLAIVDGASRYHTRLDDIAHVDPRSVQDMGDVTLAAARALGASDLTTRAAPAVAFSVGGSLVTYPAWLDPVLAVLAAVVFAIVVLRRRAVGTVLRTLGSFSACLVVSVLLGVGAWLLLLRVRPELALVIGGLPEPSAFVLAEAVAMAAATVAWARWVRRRAAATDAAAGVLACCVAFSVAAAFALPGSAYLFTGSALAGVAVLAALPRPNGAGADSATRDLLGGVLVAGAVAVPAAAVVVPLALLLVPALGPAGAAAPLVLITPLLGAVALLLAPARHSAVSRAVPAGLTVLAVLLAVTAGARPLDPRPIELAYLRDGDAGTASWLGDAGTGPPEVDALLTGPAAGLGDRIPVLDHDATAIGPAPLAPDIGLPDATVTVSGPDEAGITTVDVRLHAPDDAYALDVLADTSAHTLVDATAAGLPLPVAPAEGSGPWGFRLRVAGPPTEGFSLRLHVRGAGAPPLRLVAVAGRLPASAPLPPGTGFPPWPGLGGKSIAVRTIGG